MSESASAAHTPAAPVITGRRRTIALWVVLLAFFMDVLDTTIVNVALPQIGKELHESSGIEWVVTAYLLAVGVAQPPTLDVRSLSATRLSASLTAAVTQVS